jgi:hypothetical protein
VSHFARPDQVKKGRKNKAENDSLQKSKRATPSSVTIIGIGGHFRRNMHMNGLVCQYLPKGTDMAVYSQVEIDAIADEINNRPRKGLGVRNLLSVYRELLANSH